MMQQAQMQSAVESASKAKESGLISYSLAESTRSLCSSS